MRRSVRRGPRPGGFTLVELLVVVMIVILVSAVTLPTVLPALSHRQVSEAARILQAEITGARDRAIRYNAPRGFRLLPDPTISTSGTPGFLAFNRIVAIEPAPDYSVGRVSILKPPNTMLTNTVPYNPTAYPIEKDPTGNGPQPWPPNLNFPAVGALRIEAEPIIGGTGWDAVNNVVSALPNEPVNWWWNIRVGDKVQLQGEGSYYTVVGPCEVRPTNPQTLGQNPELFVNVGQPGDATFKPVGNVPSGPGDAHDSPLYRLYGVSTPPNAGNSPFAMACQFLYVVNGEDDNGNGYVDEGWDGVDNNLMYGVDDITEWEKEDFTGTLSLRRRGSRTRSTSDMAYSISRRAVPVAGARVTTLPAKVVIDASTLLSWTDPLTKVSHSPTYERSRLPVDPFSYYVDVMLLPTGQVVPTTIYSSQSSMSMLGAFYHFWLAEREDVMEPHDYSGKGTSAYYLPMPQGTPSYPDAADAAPRYLTGERMLITLYTKSGNVVSNTIENFNGGNINLPFMAAQTGTEEAK